VDLEAREGLDGDAVRPQVFREAPTHQLVEDLDLQRIPRVVELRQLLGPGVVELVEVVLHTRGQAAPCRIVVAVSVREQAVFLHEEEEGGVFHPSLGRIAQVTHLGVVCDRFHGRTHRNGDARIVVPDVEAVPDADPADLGGARNQAIVVVEDDRGPGPLEPDTTCGKNSQETTAGHSQDAQTTLQARTSLRLAQVQDGQVDHEDQGQHQEHGQHESHESTSKQCSCRPTRQINLTIPTGIVNPRLVYSILICEKQRDDANR